MAETPETLREWALDSFDEVIHREVPFAHAAAWEAERAKDKARIEGLIAHMLAACPDPECLTCGELCCPKGEPLHFHHDGCPSCYTSRGGEQ